MVPDDGQVEIEVGQGRFFQDQVELLGKAEREDAAERCHHVGLGDGGEGGDEVRRGERHAPVDADPGELGVHLRARIAEDGDADLVDRAIVGDGPFALRHRMPCAHDEGELVLRIGLAARAGRQRRRGGREGEIDLAKLHALDEVGRIVLEADVDARRLLRQPRHQGRGEQDGVRVDAGNADGAFGFRRIEARLAEDGLHMIERGDQLGRQRLAARGQRIAATRRADEKLVAQHIAQAGQRTTHRGLAEADLVGRLRHIAPPQQRFERREQVEVEAREMHVTHIKNTNYAFLI